MDTQDWSHIRLSDTERILLATWRDKRRDERSTSHLDNAERQLIDQWRAWQASPSTRPPWAEALRHRFTGTNRLHGMLLGGAVGESFAKQRGVGERTSAALFVLEGMIQARSSARDNLLEHALSGLQRWMHTRGVPHRDCAAPGTLVDPTSWLADQPAMLETGCEDPAMLIGLARIAAGAPPGNNHADSGTAIGLGALAALWHDDADQVGELAVELAKLTHGHPNGHRPSGVLGSAMFWLLRGKPLTESLDRGLANWAPTSLTNALRLGRNRPAGFLPGRAQIDAMGPGRSGLDVLSIAIRAATAATEDFPAAIRIAAEHGGDAGTSAMLCGQLLGALHGPAVIPAGWLSELELRPMVERLTEQAVTEFGTHPDSTDQADDAYRTGLADAPRVAASRERFVGAVLGCAIGEALGIPISADGWDEIRAKHGSSGLSDYIPAGHPAGRLGSDTQLMLFSLEGMTRANTARRGTGVDDPFRHIQHAYQRWLHTQHLSWNRAAGEFLGDTPEPDGWLVGQRALFQTRNPGRTMMRTLIAFAKGQQAMGTPEKPVSDSQGSTAVMRAVPAALWSDDPGEVFRIGMRTAALTHGNPVAFLSAGALAFLISRLVRGEDLPTAAAAAKDRLAEHSGHEEVSQRISAAVRLADADSGSVSPDTIEARLGSGWTAAEALGIGLYAALVTNGDFDRALPVAVNHSGNSATTGAVCGSLAGAMQGSERIPRRWLADLELCEVVERLGQDAVQEFGPRPPQQPEWFDRYPAT